MHNIIKNVSDENMVNMRVQWSCLITFFKTQKIENCVTSIKNNIEVGAEIRCKNQMSRTIIFGNTIIRILIRIIYTYA